MILYLVFVLEENTCYEKAKTTLNQPELKFEFERRDL